jgi:heme/copper-type cytochrome/quinol oxidase subunit 1
VHPEVYILVVPAFGIVSHAISINTGKAVFGYLGMVSPVTTNSTFPLNPN